MYPLTSNLSSFGALSLSHTHFHFESDFNSADNSGRIWVPHNRVTHPVRDTGAVRSAQSCIAFCGAAGARTWEYTYVPGSGTWPGGGRGGGWSGLGNIYYLNGPYYILLCPSVPVRRFPSVLVTICRLQTYFDTYIYAFLTDSAFCIRVSVCVCVWIFKFAFFRSPKAGYSSLASVQRHAMSLYASVGSYDNLDEPTPFFNDRAAGYGFVITFLVSFWYLKNFRRTAIRASAQNSTDSKNFQPGNIKPLRLASIICPLLCDTMSRMGRLFHNIHICSLYFPAIPPKSIVLYSPF